MSDTDANYQRPPIDVRAARVGHTKVIQYDRRGDSLRRVFKGIEKRLLSRDEERGETPYSEVELLCFATGKIKRYVHSLMTMRPGNKSEVEEALDYLVMWCMKDRWGG